MPRFHFSSWQRALGGMAGVIVLAFALTFHFFPDVLHVRPSAGPAGAAGSRPGTTTQSPGQPLRLRPSEANAGPPIALAPSEVLERRTRARIDAAMRAIAVASSAPQTPPTPEVADLLQRAQKALKTGNLTGNDDSAATLYTQALQAKRDSRTAARGLAKVHVQLAAKIEQLLADGDLEPAAAQLAALQRLPGTNVDVRRLQRTLEELRKVRPMLVDAANLLQQGKLVGPGPDNALALYRQILQLDPGNPVAEHGLSRIQRKVLDQALGAAAAGDFATVRDQLTAAANIVPHSPALEAARQRIAALRTQHADTLLSKARTALDSGDLKLAAKLKAQALSFDASPTRLAAFEQAMSNARLYASFQPGQAFQDQFVDITGKAPTMVVVPTGQFLMGSAESEEGHQADESPQHRVQIARGFAIGRSEVTVAQFRRFVETSGYVPDSVRLDGSSVYDARSGVMRNDQDATWKDDYAGRPARDDLPVVNVSWDDAHAYVQWLSKHTGKRYHLPSEAQFAYAQRAGTTTRYWWGGGAPQSKVENITGSGDQSRNGRRWTHAFRGYRDGYWGPAPVASFMPNPFGLYDMDGNVTEWVRDCWHANYTRAPDDGSAWINPGCKARVLRGGSWGSGPNQVRSAWRRGAAANTRSGRVGFRVVRLL